jgi:uncharacterized phage protein (TIGR01671 family)
MFEPGYFIQDEKMGLLIHDNYAREERYTLMQYTGLKDKNGKEIYEGDIFETQFPYRIAAVEWDEENGRFLGVTVSGGERKIAYVGREPQPIKIIGNIYENPELIKTT